MGCADFLRSGVWAISVCANAWMCAWALCVIVYVFSVWYLWLSYTTCIICINILFWVIKGMLQWHWSQQHHSVCHMQSTTDLNIHLCENANDACVLICLFSFFCECTLVIFLTELHVQWHKSQQHHSACHRQSTTSGQPRYTFKKDTIC